MVGYPLTPVYMAKAGGFFFVVFGITALMGALRPRPASRPTIRGVRGASPSAD